MEEKLSGLRQIWQSLGGQKDDCLELGNLANIRIYLLIQEVCFYYEVQILRIHTKAKR